MGSHDSEVYYLIAKGMKEGKDPELDEKVEAGKASAEMMRVSEATFDDCKTHLYDDIQVGGIDTLVEELKIKPSKADSPSPATKFHLYHPLPRLEEPSYTDLLIMRSWNDIGVTSGGHDAELERADNNKAFGDTLWLRAVGAKLREDGDGCDASVKTKGDNVAKDGPKGKAFGNLTRVVMGGMGDNSWNTVRGAQRYEIEALPKKAHKLARYPVPSQADNRSVPHFFLTLPGVEHYCQGIGAGPLALAQQYITAPNLPRTVSLHWKAMAVKGKLQASPPIVLGTTNRWLIDESIVVMSDLESAVGMSQMAEPLVTLIQTVFRVDSKIMTITPSGLDVDPFDNSSSAFANTTIEIYGYIRHIYMSDSFRGDDWDPAVGFAGRMWEISNLGRYQTVLDAMLGKWKGKVILKNLEDWDSCPACGFQPKILDLEAKE